MELLKKEIIKVQPKEGESESDYMGRCIPAMVDEGKPQDQAVAMCASMYGKSMKQKAQEAKEKDWQEKFDSPLKSGKACGDKKPKK